MPKNVGLIVFIFFALLTSILFALNPTTSVLVPSLSSSLNIIFRVGALLIVAYISAKSYMKTGLFQLLLIGCSMVAFAVGALINAAGTLLALPEWLNFALSMITVSFFVFAALNVLAGIALVYNRNIYEFKIAKRKLNLFLGFLSATLLMVCLAGLILAEVIPPFAIGSDYTSLRDLTVVGSLALFVLGTILMGKVYFESKSKVLYWYTLGLCLHVVSVSALLLSPGAGTAMSWLGSVAQFVGSVFFVIALIAGSGGFGRENGWAEAFKRNKQQFSLLFSNMNSGFAYHKMIFDKEGKPVDYIFLEVNNSFEELTGLKKANVLNKKASEVLPGIEKDPTDWISIYGKVASTGQPVRFENYSQQLQRWYSVSAYSPAKGYFATTFDDITERKKAEEALKELNEELEERIRKRTEQVSTERQRLYNVLETLPVYVILLDKDYHVPFANKVFRDIFGESHGRPCYDFLFGRKYPCENCETYKALKSNRPHRWEWTGPNGHDYDIYDFPFTESDSSTLILEMGIDITEQKWAEKQLRDASLYSRSLIEASLDPLVTINADGKITDVNQATQQVTGCSIQELIGSDFADYFTEPEEARKGYRKVFADGFVTDYPLAIRHKTGKITYVLYNASLYKDESGEVKGIFAAARDITKRKQAEEKEQESARKLKDAERLAAIGATAGMVGHDIRNPLQAIVGDIFFAKQELKEVPQNDSTKKTIESLDSIEENVFYINKIVADLQDYAKPLYSSAHETNLKTVIEQIIAKSRIPDNVEVSIKMEDEAQKINADPDYLKRIVGNLVLNAAQAMPQGGKLTIHAQLDKKTGEVILSFKDTGVGIPEEAKAKLFTPMFTTKSKGQGFGLAVVKRMTEALGGTVTFESQESKGTTFTVRLPTQK